MGNRKAARQQGSKALNRLSTTDGRQAFLLRQSAIQVKLSEMPNTDSKPLVNTLSPAASVDAWDEGELEEVTWLTDDRTAILVASVVAHLIIVLALAIVRLNTPMEDKVVLIVPASDVSPEPTRIVHELEYTEDPDTEMGADSIAQAEPAAMSADVFAELEQFETPEQPDPVDLGQTMVNQIFTQSNAPLDRLTNQKGKVGEGTQGATGAIDRLTFEILQSMEERPTLVAWLFDRSGSLNRQRREIIERFDRIYEELGILQSSDERFSSSNQKDVPLLTSIIGFGETVQLYNKKPLEDLQSIKRIIDGIEIDSSGTERVFTAIENAAAEFKRFRRNAGGSGPTRNVIFVVVTDERGDDSQRLESAIASCRKWGIPVHVIGVPAPFGREHTFVKYVDPDPNFDQSPQWAQVDQGPETLLPERVQVGFTGDFSKEINIDSGFGPYALTRLCYETGGIYFTVHPNRKIGGRVGRGQVEAYASDLRYFFDPEIMQRYRPDYLPPRDYVNLVKSSPLRQALVTAARMKPVQGVSRPRTRFVKRDDASLVGDLTVAQQDAAKLEPTLIRMLSVLQPGMEHRDSETSPRWKAGFDLAMGRVMAQKVRTETYNAILAVAKRGMPFKDPKNNVWVLKPSDEITVGSRWKREADTARMLLEDVVNQHAGTPWALLASQELKVPMGWKWTEEREEMQAPANRTGNGNNNNVPRPPQDDRRRMLDRAPKRPIPKL